MESNQVVSEYLNSFREIQKHLLQYIENEEDKENFDEFITNFDKEKINENKRKLTFFITILLKISNNHYHSPNFFNKIEKILNLSKPFLTNYFTNEELYNIFVVNKRILLYFIEEKIINLEKSYLYYDFNKSDLLRYFYPEFKADDDVFCFSKQNDVLHGDEEECDESIIVPEIAKTNFQLFDSKRKLGENDREIFRMIREDAIDEFVEYVTKTNYNLSKPVKNSMYETNYRLQKKCKLTLIEYAAFFGSIQIFQFLRLNNVKIEPSIWYYAIHGNNNDLIHILEEDGIESDKKSFYEKCYNEAIKCYNNDLANYIREKYLYQKEEDFFIRKMLENYNLIDLPDDLYINFSIFYTFCEFNYYDVVDFLVKDKLEFDINQKMILFLMFKCNFTLMIL